jgi:hypothetical protein
MNQLLIMLLLLTATACVTSPARGADAPLYRYDFSTEVGNVDLSDPAATRRAWDMAHALFAIQGIVNRDRPTLVVRFLPAVDDFWWRHVRSDGQWLAGREAVELKALDEVIERFRPQLKGTVVYDERVAATSNLASTIAGVEDRVPVRFDPAAGSMYARMKAMAIGDELRLMAGDGAPLFTGKGNVPGTQIPSTGSAKNDVYLWAKARYLDTGRCATDALGYYIDAYWLKNPKPAPSIARFEYAQLSNHDYFIARRTFFVDLHVWDDEAPIDDPDQPLGTDLRTFRSILRSLHDQNDGGFIHQGGFVPWAWKYAGPTPDGGFAGSGGKHQPVHSEWQHASILSGYNAIKDADAFTYGALANASFYRHFPMREHYPQSAKPTADSLRERGLILADGTVKPMRYVAFYAGDYDSSAWLTQFVPRWWSDPARGTVPLNWAFNPITDRRAPHVVDYARRHAVDGDWFVSGNNGVGYLIPTVLSSPRPDATVPDASKAWGELNRVAFAKYDLTVTGFIITGLDPQMTDEDLDKYQAFSPGGAMIQTSRPERWGVTSNGMPWIRHVIDLAVDTGGDPADSARNLIEQTQGDGPQFIMGRSILKSPTWHAEVVESIRSLPGGAEVQVVDAHTLLLLVKAHLAHTTAKQPTP